MKANTGARTPAKLETLQSHFTTVAIFFSAESTIFQTVALILRGVS
jgi:hypothetical protein